jgi:serine/threonine-protein kinase
VTDDLLDRLQRAFAATYTVERELGGGGMSRVFVATENALKRRVVIKVLSPELVSPVMTARFVREFEVTALLQHPHILPVLAAGEREGLLYFITPFIEGESLRHKLEREQRLPIRDSVRILGELANALAYAHERGVVHRDIKPENILLSNGLAVLADFGIAAALAGPQSPAQPAGGATRLTAVGTSIGTAGYMSPEQVAGDPNVDGRSDVYSLAVVGYEMLAGKPPFAKATAIATMTAHLTETPAPVSTIRADTPGAVGGALTRALEKDPAVRFQTAREFGDALGISFTGEQTAGRAAVGKPSRTRALAVVGIIGVVVAGAAVWAATMRGRTSALDDNLVAIAPFEVLDPSLQMWREGIVDILAANLDGAGPLHTVPPTLAVRRWNGRPDKISATTFGKATGARLAVYGRVVTAGADTVRLTATVLDVGNGRSLGDIELRESAQRMDRLADSLTVRILGQLNQTRAIASVKQGSFGGTSLTALKAFLQGEQHYRRSDWDSAAVYYKRATEADSMFAPAMRRLSNAMAWNLSNGEPGAAAAAYHYALTAGQRNHGLPARESLLVAADSQAGALNLRGEQRVDVFNVSRRLIATLEEGVRRWPNDPELWHRLGDVRFHYLYFVPNGQYADARRAFDRSIALDSAFAPSYIHMPELALRGQDPEAARRYIRLYLALNKEDNHAAQVMRMTGRMLEPGAASAHKLDSTLKSNGLQLGGQAISGMLMWMDSSETAIGLMHMADSVAAADKSLPAIARVQIRAARAVALASRGHLAESAALVDSGSWTLAPDLGMLGALPPAVVDSLIGRVTMGPPSGYWQIPLAYRWWAERGDTARLQRALDATMKLPPGIVSPTDVAALRAHVAIAKRDTATAIRELAVMPDTLCMVNFCYQFRLLKVQLLSAKRMDREAEPALRQEFPVQGPSAVLWSLERGRVFERLGKKAEAVDAYAYVSAAWNKANATLQPAVKEARDGLRRLSVEKPK